MPLPLLAPLLIPPAKVILANGVRAGVRKYGPEVVKRALKQIRKRRQAINDDRVFNTLLSIRDGLMLCIKK